MKMERRQHGFTLLLMLLLLVVTGVALLFSYYKPGSVVREGDRKTTDTLALVKTALIGWTVKRGNTCVVNAGGWVTCTGNDRPGELPCPDRDNDGLDNDGNCAPGELGRVPWKTLGIPEPKDTAGETLWYAVAGPFRTRGSNNNIINSDTRGNLAVYAADGATVLTSEAAAVIIAPGQALGNQTRAGANRNNAGNYLETANGWNNASNNGPFINGRSSSTFNDRVVYLTTPELMPAVEKRVASEVNAWLDGYRATSVCQCYPWAADFTINTSGATNHNYNTPSMVGLNRGRFPIGNAQPEVWGSGGTPALSSWFTYNNWNTVIYYAVAKQNAQGQGTLCTTCGGPTLNVDGKAVISALFLMPGTPLAATARPSNVIADYLEDGANNDGADDTYVTPAAGSAASRDHMFTSISAPAAPDTFQQCGPMGKVLRKLAPCGEPPSLNPQCARLAGTDLLGNLLPPPAAGLATCSPDCVAAALVIVNAPCQTSIKAAVCKNAYKTLDHCD
jgi:hypothetical protein